MNITDLTAKIKFNIESGELKKFSDSIDDLKKKFEELEKQLKDTEKVQKEAQKTDEKAADAKKKSQTAIETWEDTIRKSDHTTRQATGTVKKHSLAYKGLAITLYGVAKIVRALSYVIRSTWQYTWKFVGAVTSGIKWATAGTAAGVAVLERMMKSAGAFGSNLRIKSTDFGVSPEALQSWEALAERAGSSSDVMDRTLGFMAGLKKQAVANPYFLPDVLNLKGIRPAVYQNTESLMTAIMAKTRGMSQQKRLAFFERLGVSDAAEFDLIAQEWAKNGLGMSRAGIVSAANMEKLTKVDIAFKSMNRTLASIKNNILAAFSDSFIDAMQTLSKIIHTSVAVVEGFVAKHGGIKKVLGDINPILAKVYGLTGAFTALSGVVAKFGAFAVTLAVVGSGLAVILYFARSIVKAFKEAVGFAGSLKELMYGFVAMKLGELIDAGDIPQEYQEDVKKAQVFFKSGAGQFKEPSVIKAAISKITGSLDNLPKKIGQILKSVLSDLMNTFIDTFLLKILEMWSDSGILGSDWASKKLMQFYNRPDYVPNEDQKKRMERFYLEGVTRAEMETAPNVFEDNAYTRWRGGANSPAAFQAKSAYRALQDFMKEKGSFVKMFSDEYSSGYAGRLIQLMYKGKAGLHKEGKSFLQNVEYYFNINSNQDPKQIADAVKTKVDTAANKDVARNLMGWGS